MLRPKRQRREAMAAVAGIRGFREALQVRGRRDVGGWRREGRMEGQFGILVGGRTELALFTAINSLPFTAYRFLLSELLASRSSAFPWILLPSRLTRAALVLLSAVRLRCRGYSKQSQCFLSQARTSPQERGSWLAEAALSRKWWESMRSTCPSASRDARTRTRVHTR